MKVKGIINKVQPRSSHGWISRKELFKLNGERYYYQRNSSKDVFVHADDSEIPLEVGTEVIFDVVPEVGSRTGYRAINVCKFVPENHLELHIDAKAIDNPSIPLRWCFTPEIHKRMVEGTKQGCSYALLLTIRHKDDGRGNREQREIKSAKHPFSFVTFPKAGNWTIGMVLFERTEVDPDVNNEVELVRTLHRHFLSKATGMNRSYNRNLPRLNLKGFPAEVALEYIADCDQHAGKPIASSEIAVEIPAEIFAPPPSEAVQAFANRFYKQKPYDECDLRRRLMIMTLGFGWVPWLIIEAFLRSWQLVVAVGQLLFAFRGSVTNIFKSFKPAVRFEESLSLPTFSESDDEIGKLVCYPPFNSKIGFFLTPGFLALYALGIGVLFLLGMGVYRGVAKVYEIASWSPWVLIAVIAAAGIGYTLRSIVLSTKESVLGQPSESILKAEAQKRERMLQLSQYRATELEKIAPALVCGGTVTHEVSLKAVPRELRTFKMRFAAVKREVCRPFG
jgi:hypothetical protein